MTSNPIQSAPSFNAGLNSPMSAQLYYIKAKQAYAEKQWQQVCVFAQSCISAARNDEKLRFLAKEILAASLVKLNQSQQALVIMIELHQHKPDDALIIYNLALVLMHLMRYDDAIRCFQRAQELVPENVDFLMNLGLAYYKNRDFEHAKTSYQTAVKLAPKHADARFAVAWTLQAEGRIAEAMSAYEKVFELEPAHTTTLSNMIFINHYLYPFDLNAQIKLVQRFGSVLNVADIQYKHKQLQPHSPLRVGFVSSDFCDHPVGYFLYSTIEQICLDPELRRQLTLVAYSNESKEDEYTQKLRNRFDLWRRVDEWSDEHLFEQIKQDKIDILIDLSGHTQGHRLSVFAKKPAPLQVGWIGYWGSTGLAAMDYVLADPVSVPVDEERWFVEKVWRLPHLRYCFSIPPKALEVGLLPCIQSRHITFGCYQNLIKINDDVLRLWSRILTACPEAFLRVQAHDFIKQSSKDRFIERLNLAGLDLNRVKLVGGMTIEEYLASHSEVDILLDTFPYPGGTTTAEALWMGVPTLTLSSTGMLGRQGEALMVNAGLPDWVAYSEEEYVQKAIDWGNADLAQRQVLAKLRSDMREQVKESPVFNAKQFAGEFVDSLYGMWREKIKL
ncbi:MAG: tetratricopeptide repeat protein [Candidatus Saccharibacteria bacterium]|nr:tetratricopeptide repeat protein [Moraxellaceae bacterium]